MHLPFWILLPFLPVTFWPVTLPALIVLIVLAIKWRGRRRWLSIAGAAALLVPPVLGFGFLMVLEIKGRSENRAEYARTHSVLDRETALDGITFPQGTEINWTDAGHTAWSGATVPQSIDFHGLPVRSMTRSGDGWYLELTEPRAIGGWACGANYLTVTQSGELRSCALASSMTWKGWVLPSMTSIHLRPEDGTVEVVVAPYGDTAPGQELGVTLPRVVTLNGDGSLAQATYQRDQPVLVAGTPLWGNLVWRYDATTAGQGRSRPAVAVEGRSKTATPDPADDAAVSVQLPGGPVALLSSGARQ